MRRTPVVVLSACLVLASAASAAEPPKPAGIGSEMVSALQAVAEETISLAEAMPADRYSWRPGPGVRSVSEAYMHIAAGIHLLLNVAGVNPEKRYSRDSEKTVTEKGKVVEALKTSFALADQKIGKATDADLDRSVDFFGRKSTARAVYLRLVVHCWEHLGQSVAYARVNGVVPPWSQTR